MRQPDQDLGQEQGRYAVYYILTEAMAYRLTGDARFLARAKSDLMTVAAFKDWNPRHFLSVGEMSFAVGIGYDWLYAKLTPEERATLKQALMEKSLCSSCGDSLWLQRSRPTGSRHVRTKRQATRTT